MLGAFDELPFVEEGSVQVDGEAMVLLFTDGLSELRNEKGEFLEEEFGQEFIQRNYQLSADEFNEKMMARLEEFRGKAAFEDDFTVLTCKIF